MNEAAAMAVLKEEKAKKKFEKKQEKKRQSRMTMDLFLLPMMMYAGSARALLTFDKKRKFIKVA